MRLHGAEHLSLCPALFKAKRSAVPYSSQEMESLRNVGAKKKKKEKKPHCYYTEEIYIY